MDAVWVENSETASAMEPGSVEYSVTALAVEMAKSATVAYPAWWSVFLNWSVRLPNLRQSYLADKSHFQSLGSAWPNGSHSNLFYQVCDSSFPWKSHQESNLAFSRNHCSSRVKFLRTAQRHGFVQLTFCSAVHRGPNRPVRGSSKNQLPQLLTSCVVLKGSSSYSFGWKHLGNKSPPDGRACGRRIFPKSNPCASSRFTGTSGAFFPANHPTRTWSMRFLPKRRSIFEKAAGFFAPFLRRPQLFLRLGVGQQAQSKRQHDSRSGILLQLARCHISPASQPARS